MHAAMSGQPTHMLPPSRPGKQPPGMLVGFVSMPGREKVALLAAWVLLSLSAIGLRMAAFRHFAPILGRPIGPDASVSLIDDEQEMRAWLVKRAIRRAARIAPFRADCLPQVLAGSAMCRMLSIPATAYLGVQIGSDPEMVAHAWLCAGPVPVTGGSSFGEFAVVLCFAVPRPAGTAGLAGLGPNSP